MSEQNLDRYFIRVRGKVQGPYDIDQLKRLRQRGQFSRANEVSTDKVHWQSASVLSDVFAAPKRPVPAAKPADDSLAFEPEDMQDAPAFARPPVRQTSGAKTWYYAIDREQQGPVSLAEMRDLLATGDLCATDLVWKNGMAEWTPVENVPELRDSAARTPPRPAGRQALPHQRTFCFTCGAHIDGRAEICPACGVRQPGGGKAKTGGGAGIASLVLGLIGLFAWLFPPLGILICIFGLVLGIIGFRGSQWGCALAGIILSSFGLIASLGFWLLALTFLKINHVDQNSF